MTLQSWSPERDTQRYSFENAKGVLCAKFRKVLSKIMVTILSTDRQTDRRTDIRTHDDFTFCPVLSIA